MDVRKKNSMMIRVLAKNKNIFINGFPCHIIHNTANKAAERFSEVSRFDVEDFFVDLFHWFDDKALGLQFYLKRDSGTRVFL